MLRYQVFLTNILAFLPAWWYAVARRDDLHKYLGDAVWAVDWAPLIALVLFGGYALLRLIVGVATFSDCPQAARELEIQVEEAKKELRRRKIID